MLSLDNREIAIAAWFAIGSLFLYLKTDLRLAMDRVFRAAIHPKILIVLALAIIWVSLEIFSIHLLGIWDPRHAKSTTFWFFGSACLLILEYEKIAKCPNFFRQTAKSSLTWLALVEFIANLHSFSLLVELLIFPILFLLTIILAVSETDARLNRFASIVNTILAGIGLTFIIRSIAIIAFDYNSLLNRSMLAEIAIPSMLTIGFLPFLFAFHIWVSYESAFISLQCIIRDKNLLPYARWRAIKSFRHRTKFLSRWQNQLANDRPKSQDEIRITIATILKAERIANDPKRTIASIGWPPNEATKFLALHGLVQDFYHPVCDGSWMASSNYKSIGDDIFSNSISYFSVGTEKEIRLLKLHLSVNGPERSEEAIHDFINLAKLLHWKAIRARMKESLQSKLANCEEFEAQEGVSLISFKKHSWKLKTMEGFDLTLEIQRGVDPAPLP